MDLDMLDRGTDGSVCGSECSDARLSDPCSNASEILSQSIDNEKLKELQQRFEDWKEELNTQVEVTAVAKSLQSVLLAIHLTDNRFSDWNSVMEDIVDGLESAAATSTETSADSIKADARRGGYTDVEHDIQGELRLLNSNVLDAVKKVNNTVKVTSDGQSLRRGALIRINMLEGCLRANPSMNISEDIEPELR